MMTDNTFANMTILQDITGCPPTGTPLLRVYHSEIIITAAAARLLALKPSSTIEFKTDMQRKRVYMRSSDTEGYATKKVGRGYRVHCTALCSHLAELLQGYGSYKIESDNTTTDYKGDIWYGVFFRKYA